MPIESLSLAAGPKPTLDNMSEADLLKMRNDIDQRLKLDLKNINMEEELSLQYLQAKALYAEVAKDCDTPANQKAQCLNTISAVMRQISETSVAVYSVERLKCLEAATLLAVRDMPLDAKERFFTLFREHLDGK